MVALLLAAALQGDPHASLCAMAYALELRRRQSALGIPSPVDPAKLSAGQRDNLLSLEPLITEGRTWTAVAFGRNELSAAIGPAYAKMSQSPDGQAATFRSCSQIRAADREPPLRQPPPPAPGAPDQCVAENADLHREIREHATDDVIRTHALKAMSGLENGELTCGSLERAQTIWMEIGAAAGAAVAKDMDRPGAR